MPKQKLLTIFARFAPHVWLIIFLANFSIYYAFRFHVFAEDCMTLEQAAADSRCLLVWGNDIYNPESEDGKKHHGHQCGEKITLPSSHNATIQALAKYMDPRRVASVCSSTPQPTPTPVPGDTDQDGDVDIFDYNNLVSNFGQNYPQADFNQTGLVDIFDYNTLVSNFGTR